ncbi:MAG TPA: hypothetical protein VMB46_09330 [Methanomassiliicoccales archaeon]|nr:hypothetical protein [Methanomassiliicoccales archaeon]
MQGWKRIDRKASTSLVEATLAVMIVTVAATLFIATISGALVGAQNERIADARAEEARRAMKTLLSDPAFDAEGNLDLSKLPGLANRTRAMAGTASGHLLVVDLLFDDRPAIEISRSGKVPDEARQIATERASVSVRTSSSIVTAGILELYVWWS